MKSFALPWARKGPQTQNIPFSNVGNKSPVLKSFPLPWARMGPQTSSFVSGGPYGPKGRGSCLILDFYWQHLRRVLLVLYEEYLWGGQLISRISFSQLFWKQNISFHWLCRWCRFLLVKDRRKTISCRLHACKILSISPLLFLHFVMTMSIFLMTT